MLFYGSTVAVPALIVKFIIAYNLPFMASCAKDDPVTWQLTLLPPPSPLPCFIIPDCQPNGKLNCCFEAMCRPCLAQFCSRQCSSAWPAWRVQYKINFFAQNNIQFSIITLLLSNSLTRARFLLFRFNPSRSSNNKKYINYIKLIFLFSALRFDV